MPLSGTPITPVAGLGLFYPPATGTVVASADVKALAQATANRFSQLATPVALEHVDDTLGTAFCTWTGSATYVYADGGSPSPPGIDVPNLLVGDVLVIEFDAVMLFSTSAAGPDIARFQFVITDDVSGAVVAHAVVIHDTIDQLASTTQNHGIHGKTTHVVTNAGTSRIKVQSRTINYVNPTAINGVVCKSYQIAATPMRP